MLVFLFCSFHAAFAADDKKQTLDELRTRIDRLNRDLQKSEESKSEASDQLKVSEKKISDVNRSLAGLSRDQSQIGKELSELDRRIRSLRGEVGNEEATRDRLIRHQYMHGNTDALRLILSGESVSDTERQLAYLGYVTRARVTAIARLNSRLADLGKLEAESREKQANLKANAEEQKRARGTLVSERADRQRVLNRIRADINRNKREVGKLRQDEARLSRLIERIAAELARKPDPAKPREEGVKPKKPGQAVTESADASLAGRAFQSLRGKLKLPVKGELVGRFGAQRDDGGVTWKGLFIRADEGQPVRAVADGRVVYADWLRGYGNLVIVDHGGGYLSLYGHNESIAKQVGEATSAGETIASVGSTGGATDAGVYFELRQDGKPFDPVRWVGR